MKTERIIIRIGCGAAVEEQSGIDGIKQVGTGLDDGRTVVETEHGNGDTVNEAEALSGKDGEGETVNAGNRWRKLNLR
mgnify:CR=1 FL=1